MLLLLALLACNREDASDVRTPRPDAPVDTDTTEADTDTDTDSDSDTDSDTDTDTDTDTEPVPAEIEACWLGPARDHAVCVPTVAYDAALMGADYDYPPPYNGSAQYAEPHRFVDLETVDPALDVAPNFALDEFMEAYKGRYGILQSHMVDSLQAMRDDLGAPLVVTSGYRSPAYNAGVGGVTYSRHQYGDAVDLDVSSLSVEALGEVCEAYGADYVGLYEDGHTHCDWRDATLDAAYWDADRARRADWEWPVAWLEREGARWSAPADGFDEGEPFRRWYAWDADGRMIETATGRSYEPPSGAASITVVVGGHEVVSATLED